MSGSVTHDIAEQIATTAAVKRSGGASYSCNVIGTDRVKYWQWVTFADDYEEDNVTNWHYSDQLVCTRNDQEPKCAYNSCGGDPYCQTCGYGYTMVSDDTDADDAVGVPVLQ